MSNWTVCALLGWLLALLACALVPARLEEPLPLRWLRACADHPLRSGLAAALLLVASRPRRRTLGNAATRVYDARSSFSSPPDAHRGGLEHRRGAPPAPDPDAPEAMTDAPHHATTFGPFVSAQLGRCLGFNIAPARRSPQTEGSVYDQVAPDEAEPIISLRRKVPTPGVVITSAARRIIELSKAGEKLDSLVVTGNGEPTSHPELIEIVENLRELRDKWFGKAALCLVSEQVDLDAAHLRHALSMFDKPIVRFEWGTAKVFAAMTGRPGTDLKRLVEALGGVEKLILQACFAAGAGGNGGDAEVRNWIKKVGEIRPREVHLGTLEGKGGSRSKGLRALPAGRLEAIAAELLEKTGVPAQVIAAEALPV